jgi:hypothetical protein
VVLDTGWHEIACTASGEHVAIVSGGPKTFTLTPVTPFAPDETCSVKLLAGAIHDADKDDPPDIPAADYTWGFHTEPADPPAVAGFTSNSPIWAWETAIFTNTSAGPDPLAFTWDFGDGSPLSTEPNPTHLFQNAGIYTVTLTATNGAAADAYSDIVEVRLLAVYVPAIMADTDSSRTGSPVGRLDRELPRALPGFTLPAAGLHLGLTLLPPALALLARLFHLSLARQPGLFAPFHTPRPDFFALALLAQLQFLTLLAVAGLHFRPFILVIGRRSFPPGMPRQGGWVAALGRAGPAGQVFDQNIPDRLQQRIVVARGRIAGLFSQDVAQRA